MDKLIDIYIYIIQKGYLLFLWYIKKCIFLNVIFRTFDHIYHTFKTKIKIGKKHAMKIIFFLIKHNIFVVL